MTNMDGPRRLAWIGSILLAAGLPAFAGNSHKITFYSAVILNATTISAGDYKAHWEYHGPGATVTFRRGHHVVATVQGKRVQYKDTFPDEQIVYEKKADGSKTLLEIRFAGTNDGIVLRDYAMLPSNAELKTETMTAEAKKP